MGPAGGKRGYAGITGHVSNGLAWYINGFMVPELWLRRGLTYAFRVYGGNNPHSPEYYHPLVITDEPRGGFDRLTEAKQNEIRVLAGVEFTRRGRPKPTAGKIFLNWRHCRIVIFPLLLVAQLVHCASDDTEIHQIGGSTIVMLHLKNSIERSNGRVRRAMGPF